MFKIYTFNNMLIFNINKNFVYILNKTFCSKMTLNDKMLIINSINL